MRVVIASSEMYPFAKSGGLADMVSSLSVEMASKSVDIEAIVPLYSFVDMEKYDIVYDHSITIALGSCRYDIEYHRTIYRGVRVIFVHNEILCERERMYGDPERDYDDNDLRFAIFSKAIARRALGIDADIVHLNDWHTAPVAYYLYGYAISTLFTIHNLAYQGIFDHNSIYRCGLESVRFDMEGMEYYGMANWMKMGILYSDAFNTVSPGYAEEIMTPEYGFGLDGFLRKHSYKCHGILNGIDYGVYDPSCDEMIVRRYDSRDSGGKRECKKYLADYFNIDKYEKAFFIFIGRFVEQKGVDILLDAMERVSEMDMEMIILGSGESIYEERFRKSAMEYDNISLYIGYDERLSHSMYAGADFLLMPSRFEPCGLNQMIAMRYGTIPIVNPVGGLGDTVVCDIGAREYICGSGIRMSEYSSQALVDAVEKAIFHYRDREDEVRGVSSFDMECDFSIERCAEEYQRLYNIIKYKKGGENGSSRC
jgi:starch synthase